MAQHGLRERFPSRRRLTVHVGLGLWGSHISAAAGEAPGPGHDGHLTAEEKQKDSRW